MLKFFMQLVLVYLQPFCCNLHSLLKCALQPKNAKYLPKSNLYFGDSGSFKVINADKTKKLVFCACYDKQLVCAYLQPFLH